jgi:hypothetical protein
MAAQLIFRGVRYKDVVRIECVGSDQPVFAITAEGDPKPWSTQEPEAWWRTFVDSDCTMAGVVSTRAFASAMSAMLSLRVFFMAGSSTRSNVGLSHR